MSSYWTCRRTFPVMLVLISVTYMIIIGQFTRSFKSTVADQNSGKHKSHNTFFHKQQGTLSRFDVLQQERQQRVISACSTIRVTPPENIENVSFKLIYAENYKLAYISVPKIGSTFLKKLFYVLKYGLENAYKIFDKMRSEVHAMSGELLSQIHGSDLDQVTTLVAVRNPYSRLYSAYLDKVYLPLSISLGKRIIHRNFKDGMSNHETIAWDRNSGGYRSNSTKLREKLNCTANITFNEFLNYALKKPITGKILFDHYSPISILLPKHFCQLKHVMIIKQETFDEDAEHVLKQLNVNENVYDLFHTHLHDARAEATITSVIDTTYRRIRMQSETAAQRDCWTMPVLAERLWKSFQLQGYIDNKEDFPRSKFSEKAYHDQGFLINIMQHQLSKKQLSQNEREKQRLEALLDAYRYISNSTYRKIQEIYETDFKMFGYDKDFSQIVMKK